MEGNDSIISKEGATQLLKQCQTEGIFGHMKEPVETFELLDKLGAEV
jgi:hypothetical protein